MATKTLVDTDSTQTLTNKTLTSPTVSSPTLSGTATGTYTLAGTPTITAPTISTPIITGDITADRLNTINGFRLSLTTAVPVTTSDVTGAGTLYCIPYTGNVIALYSGSTWVLRDSAQFSLALTATSGKPYDVFCYDNSGVPTLETLVWTNDTTRATALTYQDGILVKTGATTRRYLGTFYASGANTTEDSLAKRYLWNYYHRVKRPMKVVEATNSWTYSDTAWHQANAAAANQLDYVQGVSEDAIFALVAGDFVDSAGGPGTFAVGIGVDSTSANSALLRWGVLANINANQGCTATYYGFPGVGRHTLVWLESSNSAGATTWYGDNGSADAPQTGIIGEIWG